MGDNMRAPWVGAVLAIVLGASTQPAAAITYALNFTFTPHSYFEAGHLTGTVETDGTIGAIGTSNIVSFSLGGDISGSMFSYAKPGGGAVVTTGSTGLVATASELIFDFGGSSSRLFFTDGGPVNCLVQFLGLSDSCFGGTRGVGLFLETPSGRKNAFLNLFGAKPIAAIAPVPLPAGLPLLAGGLAAIGLLGWRRKRAAPSA